MKNTLYLGAGIIVGLILVVVGWKVFSPPYQYQGSLIDPSVTAPDFSLVDQNGEKWTLSENQGKVVVMFFGYTSCPDVCPLTLSKFKQIKSLMGKDSRQVVFVYITVDPERDTPEKLKHHLDAFDPEFIGLSETRTRMENVWKNYGVFQAKVETESATGYLIDHSATTYVVNQDGHLRLTFPYGMDASSMAEDLVHVIKESDNG